MAKKLEITFGLVPGVTPHSKDDAITKAIELSHRKHKGTGTDVVAIQNDEGTIYRYTGISGLQHELDLADRLEELGLVDHNVQGLRLPRGVWALFGTPLDMSIEAQAKRVLSRKADVIYVAPKG